MKTDQNKVLRGTKDGFTPLHNIHVCVFIITGLMLALVTHGIYTSSSRQTALWTVSETAVRHPGRRWKKAIYVGAKCGPLMRRCETSGSEIPPSPAGTLRLGLGNIRLGC